MIDKALKDIIINRIRIIADEQSDRLMREIDRLRADAASRGFPLMPGDTQFQIKELYERYYSNLPGLMVQAMRDVLLKAKPKPSSELSRELKDMVLYAISPNNIDKSLRFEGIDSDIAKTVIISSPNRFLLEIDLIMRELVNLGKGEVIGSESYIKTYNINALGGIVQTGNNATAEIIVINEDNKEELYKAIGFILNVMSNANDFHRSAKEETKELIYEVKSEVEKPKPNGIKLRYLLFGIATTVQSLASMKPAYEALKTAASAMGIHLP
jgi:hypothetical protein